MFLVMFGGALFWFDFVASFLHLGDGGIVAWVKTVHSIFIFFFIFFLHYLVVDELMSEKGEVFIPTSLFWL